MGGRAHAFLVGGSAQSIDVARQRVSDLEQRWSRFIPTSDISLLNAQRGQWIDVSPDTIVLINCLLRARTFTGGSFDPFLLDPLRAAGYDRSFDGLVDEPGPAAPTASSSPAPLDDPPIEMDAQAGRAALRSVLDHLI